MTPTEKRARCASQSYECCLSTWTGAGEVHGGGMRRKGDREARADDRRDGVPCSCACHVAASQALR